MWLIYIYSSSSTEKATTTNYANAKKKKTMCVVDNIVHDPKKVINNTHAHKVQPGVLFLIVRA